MAKAGEGPSAAPSSGYGGGAGAGGKFRKRPFRMTHTTPYDRPPTGLRNPSWLSKLVVEPASKLIASGAERFFASVFRKRLPPPPQPPPELNQDSMDGQPETVQKAEAEEAPAGDGEILHRSSGNGGISDLEQLLRKKTFTRSEIDRLTELLHSRAVDAPLKDDVRRTEANDEKLVANFERQQQYVASPLEEKKTRHDRSHGLISTPGISARILEEDVASPAEIAKAYMGNQASKVSPSMLGLRTRAIREDAALLSNVSFTPKSTMIPLATKAGAHVEVPENGYTTPRSRGRSAIYNMARTPYSRVHPTAFEKGSGSRLYGFGGPSLSAASVKEPNRELGSNRMGLKRRSSAMDDDIGSIGPMRRIRQKPSLLPHKTFLPQGIGGVSAAHPHSITDERVYKGSKITGENDDNRTLRTSYAHVPPKSSEMASKILEHLEKMTPKTKPAELKLIAAREKSPAKLTTDMLSGQALKSLEDAGSSKLLDSDCVGDKLEGDSLSKQVSSWDSTRENDKTEENGLLKLDSQNNVAARAEHSDVMTSVKGTFTSVQASDSVSKLVAQRPQKKRAFMMSAPEDSLDLDDDTNFNGPVSELLPKGNSNLETAANQNSASGEKSLLNKVPALPEFRTPAEPISGKTTDLESGDAANVGPEKAGTSFPFSITSNATTASVTTVPSSPDDNPKQASDKVLGSENPSLLSGADHSEPKPWFLTHPKPETLSSSDGVASTVTDASVKTLGSEKGIENNLQEAVMTNGKMGPSHSVALSTTSSGSVSSTVPNSSSNNGPPAVSPFIFSSTSAPVSTGLSNSFLNGTSNFTSSASTTSSTAATSISAASSGVPFSSTEAALFPKMPIFNSGSSSNPSISAFSAPNVETPVTKAGKEVNTGNPNNLLFGTTVGTGSSIFGLNSKIASSTAVSQSQDSLSSSGNVSALSARSSLAGSGTAIITEGLPVQLGSSASSPIFGTSGVLSFTSNNTLFSSSTTAAKPIGPSTDLGPCSSASFSETKSFGTGSGATSSIFSFHASPSSSSVTNAISSNGASAPTFSFGASSTATVPVTNAISSSSDAATVFGFGGSSSAANVVSSSSGSSSGIFGVSPLSSSAENNPASSSGVTTSIFGGSWHASKSTFSSAFSSSPSAGFSFGSSSFGSANTAPMVFGSSPGGSSGPVFSFTTTATSTSSSQSIFGAQPAFVSSAPSFAAAAGNNDQMNTEDSMAEDPVQSSMSTAPVFGQQPVSPSPGSFMFGSTVQSQTSPFQFVSQQNQSAPQNTSLFQASGSQEFGSAGGSFSLGSAGVGGDKSSRRIVKINRNRNRKK